MGIGSGIVADSEPESEWQECLLKGNFLTRSTPDFQLIETLLWKPETGFFLLEYHLDRLLDSAGYFCFSCDREAVSHALQKTVAGCTVQQRVRMVLHRDGNIEVTRVDFASPPAGASLPGVVFSSFRVDARNRFYFHKTTRRSLFDKEYARCAALGYRDVLFVNIGGQVTEGAVSTVFIRRRKEDKLLTPPLSCGLLAGTYRRLLLSRGEAVEAVLTVQDLAAADEIWIANSVRGLVRVRLDEGLSTVSGKDGEGMGNS
jgi:para-aminobenzoate synthetase/4-amino-4-deoxychorismate lyase